MPLLHAKQRHLSYFGTVLIKSSFIYYIKGSFRLQRNEKEDSYYGEYQNIVNITEFCLKLSIVGPFLLIAAKLKRSYNIVNKRRFDWDCLKM